jgi:ATP-dependent NAD(P)H-hydrate dehydratase
MLFTVQRLTRLLGRPHLPKMSSFNPSLHTIIPQLASSLHKGQAGRVATLGGCREYTGAPYYAAFAALRVGADLSHVFCTRGAASVIKSFSPELIVHGVLVDDDVGGDDAAMQAGADAVSALLPRVDVLTVGPGLGRDRTVQAAAALVIKRAVASGTPLVLDGDGLFLLTQQTGLLAGATSPVVLTPNVNEFARLCAAFLVEPEVPSALSDLCSALGSSTVVVQKGATDVIAAAAASPLTCSAAGSLRRCGGQGDVLAGAIACFLGWAVAAAKREGRVATAADAQLAAYGGCLVTRLAAERAFALRRRAMLTTDVIAELGPAFEAALDGLPAQ